MSPQVAQLGRYYERAKYMTDLNWALLLGGTVIKKDTWAQIPADIKPALLKAMQEAGAKLQADIRQSGEKDVAAMKTAGPDRRARSTPRRRSCGGRRPRRPTARSAATSCRPMRSTRR